MLGELPSVEIQASALLSIAAPDRDATLDGPDEPDTDHVVRGQARSSLTVVCPDLAAVAGAQWMDGPSTAQWLRQRNFAGVRQCGAIVQTIAAKDEESAAEMASEHLDRLVARVTIGARAMRVEPHEYVYVDGFEQQFPRRRPRRVGVFALQREGHLFPSGPPTPVDAAWELVAYLEHASPAVAVAGAWAGIVSRYSALAATEGRSRQRTDWHLWSPAHGPEPN